MSLVYSKCTYDVIFILLVFIKDLFAQITNRSKLTSDPEVNRPHHPSIRQCFAQYKCTSCNSVVIVLYVPPPDTTCSQDRGHYGPLPSRGTRVF